MKQLARVFSCGARGVESDSGLRSAQQANYPLGSASALWSAFGAVPIGRALSPTRGVPWDSRSVAAWELVGYADIGPTCGWVRAMPPWRHGNRFGREMVLNWRTVEDSSWHRYAWILPYSRFKLRHVPGGTSVDPRFRILRWRER